MGIVISEMRGALLSLLCSVFTTAVSGQGVVAPPAPPLPQQNVPAIPPQASSFLADTAAAPPVPAATKAEALAAAATPPKAAPVVQTSAVPTAPAVPAPVDSVAPDNFKKYPNFINEKENYRSAFNPSELDNVSDLLSLPRQTEPDPNANAAGALTLPPALDTHPSADEQGFAAENEDLYSEVQSSIQKMEQLRQSGAADSQAPTQSTGENIVNRGGVDALDPVPYNTDNLAPDRVRGNIADRMDSRAIVQEDNNVLENLSASKVQEAALDDKLGVELLGIVEQIQDMQKEVADALKD